MAMTSASYPKIDAPTLIIAIADFPFTVVSDMPGISTRKGHLPGNFPCFGICGGGRGSLDTTSAMYRMVNGMRQQGGCGILLVVDGVT